MSSEMSVAFSPFWLRKGTLDRIGVFVGVLLLLLVLSLLSVLAQPATKRTASAAAACRIAAGDLPTPVCRRPDHAC